MAKFAQFFEEENGQLSALRLYSFVALIVAAVLTFQGGAYELILTWIVAAFAPKVIGKLAENKVGQKNVK